VSPKTCPIVAKSATRRHMQGTISVHNHVPAPDLTRTPLPPARGGGPILKHDHAPRNVRRPKDVLFARSVLNHAINQEDRA
jgi:hypothetical protein